MITAAKKAYGFIASHAMCYRLERALLASGGIVAHLARGGSTIDSLVINVAYDLSNGGDGSYGYAPDNDSFIPRVNINFPYDYRYLREKPTHPANFYFTSHYNAAAHGKTDAVHILLKLRHPRKQIPSYATHLHLHMGYSREEALAKATSYYIDFFNAHWPLCNKPNTLLTTYESACADPFMYYRNFANFLALGIDSESIARALELCSREATKAVISNHSGKVSARGSYAKRYDAAVSEQELEQSLLLVADRTQKNIHSVYPDV